MNDILLKVRSKILHDKEYYSVQPRVSARYLLNDEWSIKASYCTALHLGVWFDVGTSNARKICALGVKNSRWVSMHGFAFNVNPDLTYFENIIPCGITDKKVTSLQKELGKSIDMSEVKNKLKTHLVRLFEIDII